MTAASEDPSKRAIEWKFGPDPAELTSDEFWERYGHWNMPEKFEAMEGKLFWSEAQREHVLGMLIEAIGTERLLAFLEEARSPAVAEEREDSDG